MVTRVGALDAYLLGSLASMRNQHEKPAMSSFHNSVEVEAY
jgi:hypothetical protein